MTMIQSQLKTLQAVAFGNVNIAPRPAANTYTPYNLTVGQDPSGIIINPLTANALTTPQMQMPLNQYQSGMINLRILQGARGALGSAPRIQIGIFFMTAAGVGSWQDWTSQAISTSAIVAGNEINTSLSIPFYAPNTALIMTGTLGINTEFGSGVTYTNIQIFADIKCTATNF